MRRSTGALPGASTIVGQKRACTSGGLLCRSKLDEWKARGVLGKLRNLPRLGLQLAEDAGVGIVQHVVRVGDDLAA